MIWGIIILAVLLVGSVSGLVIWVLGERKKKHAAERQVVEQHARAEDFGRIAHHNENVAKEAREQTTRLENQIATLRGRLNEARVRLAEAGDPKAIKQWLDAELKAEEL